MLRGLLAIVASVLTVQGRDYTWENRRNDPYAYLGDARNWENDYAPAYGADDSDLKFNNVEGSYVVNENISWFRTLTFGPAAGEFVFSSKCNPLGNPVGCVADQPLYVGSGGVANFSSSLQSFKCRVVVAEPQVWTAFGEMSFRDVVVNQELTINPQPGRTIGLNGYLDLKNTRIRKIGLGTLQIHTDDASTAIGEIVLSEGKLLMNAFNRVRTSPTLVMNGGVAQLGTDLGQAGYFGTLVHPNVYDAFNRIEVRRNSALILNGLPKSTLTFGSGVWHGGRLLISGVSGCGLQLSTGTKILFITNPDADFLKNVQFAGYARGATMIGNEMVPIQRLATEAARLFNDDRPCARDSNFEIGTVTDSRGFKLRYYCSGAFVMEGTEPDGTKGNIAWCPSNGGRNFYTCFINGAASNPDCITAINWTHFDCGADDNNDGRLDEYDFTYRVGTKQIIARHYSYPTSPCCCGPAESWRVPSPRTGRLDHTVTVNLGDDLPPPFDRLLPQPGLLKPSAIANASTGVPANLVIERNFPDLNSDGKVDGLDRLLFVRSLGKCEGEIGYDPNADIDASGCIDQADANLLDYPVIEIFDLGSEHFVLWNEKFADYRLQWTTNLSNGWVTSPVTNSPAPFADQEVARFYRLIK